MARPPFVLSRETEQAAINHAVRDAAKRKLLCEIVDLMLRVRESGKVSAADLAPIRAGFEASDEAVWSRAAGWLAKLCAFAPELSTVVEELSRHRSANVRFHLCASLDEFPRDVAVPYLRQFLNDASGRVRGTVPNLAVKARYSELLPDFERLLNQPKWKNQQEELKEAIALLRGEIYVRADGWKSRKLPDGGIEFSPPDM